MGARTAFMKVAMVFALVAIALFGLGLPALAADGPTPPELGDPTSETQVVPHGGYSSGTDFCLQCHSVHTAPDPGFALMARSSTTGVCATCHAYGIGAVATGPDDPGFDPQVEGTASTRAVYTSTAVHIIGANGPTTYTAGWSYGWRYGGPSGPGTTRTTDVLGTATSSDGGLYCASCHTPHGEFGQLINSRWVLTTADQAGGSSPVEEAVVPWQNDTRIWWDNPTGSWEQRYLYRAAVGQPWYVCTLPGGGGACTYAQVEDSEGQLVSLYGYKLLSSSPNHQYPYRSGSTFTETGTSTPPGAGLYSNAGAMIGDLVGAIIPTDLTFTVDETTGALTGRP
ncbi:MAG TPA: cytochrome c3 family protein, partial [Actinomycetota bacterium]|nr:cytochrome c3 family protein [Actinomycetota bacterium]